jgi:hypothetical protein
MLGFVSHFVDRMRDQTFIAFKTISPWFTPTSFAITPHFAFKKKKIDRFSPQSAS